MLASGTLEVPLLCLAGRCGNDDYAVLLVDHNGIHPFTGSEHG